MSKNGKLSVKAIIALVFVFAGLVSVIAYGTNNPSVFGHSAQEIDFTGMSGNVVTTGDVQGSRVCIGTDCRTSWPSSSGSTGADPNSNTNINAVWNFMQSSLFHENIRFTDANEGIVFYGGGEAITGSADYGIDFKSQNGKVRMKVNNDGRVEIFDRLCLNGVCKSDWPTSSSQVSMIHTTVGEISSLSHKSLAQDGVAQWMITGGHRFCVAKGYTTGTVVEYYSDNSQDSADVSCFN
jgi:hypothetical protein